MATKPLLTIFGQKQDPFGYQKRWKALYPHAAEHVVAGGHHFPMNDDPGLFAHALRDFAS
jgi:pimeloyl-ACP methyl ester carboxylesterase